MEEAEVRFLQDVLVEENASERERLRAEALLRLNRGEEPNEVAAGTPMVAHAVREVARRYARLGLEKAVRGLRAGATTGGGRRQWSVSLTRVERELLANVLDSDEATPGERTRSAILLELDAGDSTVEVAGNLGVHKGTVSRVGERYRDGGLAIAVCGRRVGAGRVGVEDDQAAETATPIARLRMQVLEDSTAEKSLENARPRR